MTKEQQTEVEAAAFRALVAHLQQRSDVQNIDLMNLAGFCRNCLSKWYSAEAKKLQSDFDYADAQQYVYGMSNADWKRDFQTRASNGYTTTRAGRSTEHSDPAGTGLPVWAHRIYLPLHQEEVSSTARSNMQHRSATDRAQLCAY